MFGVSTAIMNDDYEKAFQECQRWQQGESLRFRQFRITKLPLLPNGLTHLDCCFMPFLTYIPCDILPNTLKYLGLEGTKINKIYSLPPTLETLNCRNSSLTELCELPPTLKNLNIMSTKISVLPPLPPALEVLNIEHVPIKSLPPLPDRLATLWMSWTLITEIEALPNSLVILDCRCGKLEKLPDVMPSTLEYMNLNLCTNFKKLPSRLPGALQDLQIGSTAVTELPPLPSGLETLCINNLKIKDIGELPPTLIGLYVIGSDIIELPTLPNTIRCIDISYTRVTKLPDILPLNLTQLIAKDVLLMTIPDMPVTINPDDLIFRSYYFRQYSIEVFETPRIYSKAVQKFRKFTDSLEDNLYDYLAKKRSIRCCKVIKEELIAAAWHPRRVVEWCDPNAFDFD